MGMLTERNRLITVVVQVLLWLLFGLLLLMYLPSTWGQKLPVEFWIKQGAIFFLLVGAYYLNAFLLVPRILLKGRSFLYVIVALLLALLITFLIQYLENALHLPEIMDRVLSQRGGRRPRPVRPNVDMFMLLVALLVIGISTSVTTIQKWQHDARVRQLLEKDKIHTELSYLKAQINPHFFFNTLNNIYALTHIDIENSRKALHKLSRMMRYLLYETQNKTARLSEEIAFIIDYIELMKLRVTDKVTVVFQPPSLTEDLEIAPMLFLPFVENAFKHGVSAVEPGLIKIDLKIAHKSLSMILINTIYNGKRTVVDESNGIGMNNTRRRLDLLYPGKYSLEVNEDLQMKEFRVTLSIDLS